VAGFADGGNDLILFDISENQAYIHGNVCWKSIYIYMLFDGLKIGKSIYLYIPIVHLQVDACIYL
jgi:hypothetical protein